MEHTSLQNFINNAENIISNTITNGDFLRIETNEGNVILMPEHQYDCLVESMCRNKEE